jgi:translation initiation factor 2-alpha kinase 3
MLPNCNNDSRKVQKTNCVCVCSQQGNILDLVVCYISGGKETRTYGVSVKTGQVVYECSMEGCKNSTENLTSYDLIVIQRHTQTVRAIEARTGTERLVYKSFYHGQSGVAVLHRQQLAPMAYDISH